MRRFFLMLIDKRIRELEAENVELQKKYTNENLRNVRLVKKYIEASDELWKFRSGEYGVVSLGAPEAN